MVSACGNAGSLGHFSALSAILVGARKGTLIACPSPDGLVQTIGAPQPNHTPSSGQAPESDDCNRATMPEDAGGTSCRKFPHLLAKRFSHVLPTAIDMALIELLG
jgi:hypothetical protein